MSGAPSREHLLALGASARCSSAYCGSTSHEGAAARSPDPTRSPSRAPPSGSRTQPRCESTASGTSTWSGHLAGRAARRGRSRTSSGARPPSARPSPGRVPQGGRPRAQVRLFDGARPAASGDREPLVDPVRASASQAGDDQALTPRLPPCARGCTPTTGAPACRRRRPPRRGTCRAGTDRGAAPSSAHRRSKSSSASRRRRSSRGCARRGARACARHRRADVRDRGQCAHDPMLPRGSRQVLEGSDSSTSMSGASGSSHSVRLRVEAARAAAAGGYARCSHRRDGLGGRRPALRSPPRWSTK